MKRSWWSFLLVPWISVAWGGEADPGRVIWTGRSAEFTVTWSSRDLVIEAPGRPALSFRDEAQAEWKRLLRDAGDQEMDFELSYELLSVVGPFLSIEESANCDCGGAHPSASSRIRAIDLRKSSPGHLVEASLSEVFPAPDVLAAILGDKVVKKALAAAGKPAPTSVSGLLEDLEFQNVTVGECGFVFSKDLLQSFAFHHRERGRVAVRLSLSHGEEVCRGRLTSLGILLPEPPALASAIHNAAAKQAGLLMADVVQDGAATQLDFTHKPRRRKRQ